MNYLLGIDVGTSGTKSILYNELGREINSSSHSYELISPENGYAEQRPTDWWTATISCIQDILEDDTICASSIVGIGVSGQMHGLVMLDENDNVLHNSIIWCDTRCEAETKLINDSVTNYVEHTLNPAIVGFTLPKLLWVKENLPEVYSKVSKVMLPKDYINYMLTGVFATDVSDASGTGYFDVANRCWSEYVLNALNIPIEWLPKVYESSDVIGNVSKDTQLLTGLCTSTIVVAGAGDQAAAGLGNGILSAGDSSVSLGSSGVVFTAINIPKCEKSGRVHTFCHAVPDMWHIMGVTQGAGVSLNWFKNNFASEMSYNQLDKMAKDIPFGSDGLIYLPYLQGERTPHLDSNIRASFVGISVRHEIGHLYRSVLEGVAFSLNDCKQLIEGMGVQIKSMVASGGGAKSAIWLAIIADIMKCELVINEISESGTRGVAMLASVGAKVYSDLHVADKMFSNKVISQISVDVTPVSSVEELYSMYKELYDLLRDNNIKLSKFRNN